MKALALSIRWIDRFLSLEIRQMETRDLFRARFLVFSILFTIPCNFFPCILHVIHEGTYSIWIYESMANVLLCFYLIWHLRSAAHYLKATRIFLVWMHLLVLFALVAMPTVFSPLYFWSPCLIVLSSLIFGMRGAVYSFAILTSSWLLNLFWQFHHGSVWISTGIEAYVELMTLHVMGSCLFMAMVTGVYEFLRELSYNEQARKRLLAARHAHTGAVGELVGHVAHEVNNPLAILQGSAARLRRQFERNEWSHEARKLLGNMQRSHDRIVKVQQGLTVFASGNQYEPFVSCDVRTLMRDVQIAMKPQAQVQKVFLDFVDRSTNSTLRCQPHQLVYVLCSLIQNALDALRDSSDPRILVEVKFEGRFLAISVSDNGKGIAEALQDHIFQPFFTTKSGGTAQGLSLSVCRGILADHGGEISFQSQNESTSFLLHIPRDVASVKQRKGV